MDGIGEIRSIDHVLLLASRRVINYHFLDTSSHLNVEAATQGSGGFLCFKWRVTDD